MDIEVRFRSIDPSDALRGHVSESVQRRFQRLRGAVESVVVRIEDVNGPRGGLDKVCQVTAQGVIGHATVEERGADPYVVVSGAIARAATSLEKRRARGRRVRIQAGRSDDRR